MASSVQAYKVTINNSNSGSATPKDGFIDNKRIEDYGLNLKTTPGGMTLALSKAKRRANLRYREIINQLERVANCHIPGVSITNGAATAITEATSFAFQLYAERGAGSFTTADELVPGATLTGDKCIKRCIARALTADFFYPMDVFDPTSTVAPGTTTSVPRFGVRIDVASNFEIGAYETNLTTAEGMVTVTAA